MGLISFLRQASSKDGTKGKRQDLTEGCLMQDLRRDLLRSDQRKRALWEQVNKLMGKAGGLLNQQQQ